MMRKALYIIFALICLSCTREIFPEEHQESIGSGVSTEISPSAYVNPAKLPPAATKALIDVTTVAAIEGNVLRIDERMDDGQFDGWKNAYIIEATVASAPSASPYLRSMSLNPAQAYKVDEENSEFYHTRMIGWYPRTCVLHKNDEGKASLMQFSHYRNNYNASVYSEADGEVVLNFTGLDGSKDIMVSNIVEGQYWHVNDGEERYTVPFGHSNAAPVYANYMTYRHYLSAVKVYAVVENSSQDVSMWGALRKVIVKNQPDKVAVTLLSPNSMTPATVATTDGKSVQENALEYGNAAFSGNVDFPLLKTPMYGTVTDDGNDPGVAEDAPYLDSKNPVYLGYALIEPNTGEYGQKLELDIHTEAGVLSVAVPMTVDNVSYFMPGYVYQVNISFNTEGAIADIVLQAGDEHYYDLSKGVDLGVDEDEDGVDDGNSANDFVYQYSNCYIISPDIKRTLGNGDYEYYDGYAFSATTIGSEHSKVYSEFASDRTHNRIDPVRAGLLWESSRGLVTQVEYLYGYVRFKVQPPQIKVKKGNSEVWEANLEYKEGNAVIAVYDSQRKVLWSWHIWITETPEPVTYLLTDNVEDNGANPVSITILDRNLGATSATVPDDPTEQQILDTYGLYYQWGRKDPSMGPSTPYYRPQSTVTQDYYDYYGSKWNYAGVVMMDRPGIRDGVENPMYLILPTDFSMTTYQYDWLYTSVDNLWGTHNEKTIYDPCPYGYMVPQDEISTLFASNSLEKDKSENGYTLTAANGASSFFPFAGYKGADKGVSSLTGAWKHVGEKGDYMSSKIEDNKHRSRTYISEVYRWTEYGADADNDGHGDASRTYASYIYADDMANRRTAASVRCVKMDDVLGASLSASFVGDRAYAFVNDGQISFVYNVKASGDGVSITSAKIEMIRDVYDAVNGEIQTQTTTDIIPVENEPVTLADMVTYDVPADICNGLARYRLVTTASNGVISRVSHMLRLFEIQDLKIGDKAYNEVQCSSGDKYPVSFTLNGVESDFSVLVNGKLATKNSSASDQNGYNSMKYSVSGINIPGHLHIQILDADDNIACEVTYDVDMEDEEVEYKYSIDKSDYIKNVEQLEGGGLYMLVSYQSYNSNRYCLVNRNGTLSCELYNYPDDENAIDKSMLFRFHKAGTPGGVSSYANANAGVWKSESDGKYLTEGLTFDASESQAVYMTLINKSMGYYSELYLRNEGIQFGLSRKIDGVLYDYVSPTWCWDTADRLWQYFCVYQWRIHPVTAEEATSN